MYYAYQSCIQACLQCIAICENCASSCLKEPDIMKMTTCIQLDLECAAICKAAVDLMSLGSQHANAVCQLCGDICTACAIECENHDMEHCQTCAAACRYCAEECNAMVAA